MINGSVGAGMPRSLAGPLLGCLTLDGEKREEVDAVDMPRSRGEKWNWRIKDKLRLRPLPCGPKRGLLYKAAEGTLQNLAK